MRDIERELRALGERAEIERPTEFTPRMRRRIRNRRVVTVSAGAFTAIALLLTSTYVLAGAFYGPPVPPAGDEGFVPVDAMTLYADFGAKGSAVVEVDFHADRACVDISGVKGRTADHSVLFLTSDEESIAPKLIEGRGQHTICLVIDPGALDRIAAFPTDHLLAIQLPGNDQLVAPLSTEPLPGSFSDCGPPVGFEPTYLPAGWISKLQTGSGGGSAWQGVIGHFGSGAPAGTTKKAEGGFADLIVGESPYPLARGTKIRVLDDRALFGAIHEGFAVTFTHEGCDYVLVGYVGGTELRRFAEGLRLVGRGGRGQGFPNE